MQRLQTRDGRICGNAVIVREAEVTEPMLVQYLGGRKLWWVETDFGNITRLTDVEIDEWYFRGPEGDYDEWSAARRRLINATRVDPG